MATFIQQLLAEMIKDRIKDQPDCGDEDCPIHQPGGLQDQMQGKTDESVAGNIRDINSTLALSMAVDTTGRAHQLLHAEEYAEAQCAHKQADLWLEIHNRLRAYEANEYRSSGFVGEDVDSPPPYQAYAQFLKSKAEQTEQTEPVSGNA